VSAARAVGYVNAGTVEFVLDTGGRAGAGDGEPYFLEMNTRLQVEHPVTEEVTGLDLVRLQLLIAGGAPLPDEVHDAVTRGPVGHAVEARLYAEDPAAGWLPSTGDLHAFAIRTDRPGVRVDAGVAAGGTVSPHYDPMLAKVVVHAPTRAEAVAGLAAALADARIHGVTTNRDLLVRTLRHEAFGRGATDTGFLDRHGLGYLAAPLADGDAVVRHAVAAALTAQAGHRLDAAVLATLPSGWRNNTDDHQTITFDAAGRDVVVDYRMARRGSSLAEVAVDGAVLDASAHRLTPDGVSLTVGGVTRRYAVQRVGPVSYVDGPDGSSTLIEEERYPVAGEQDAAGSSLAPMPGNVVRVAVEEGSRVTTGQALVVLEAMKMEHTVHAGPSGVVTRLAVAEGDQVVTGQVLVVVEADGETGDDTVTNEVPA
jgi:acetyl/propionyl-CoA carboxylase alpha subunit